MSKVIKYKSDNGYSGILYGKSSMSIYNPEGKEVFHTGFRRKEINTLEHLKEHVDTFPDFQKLLSSKISIRALDDNDLDDDDNF